MRNFSFDNNSVYRVRDKDTNRQNDEGMEIKAYIFKKLYEKTGMLFDMVGRKRHFYEPQNMRKLNHFSNFINKLKVLEEGQNNLENILRYNFEELLGDFSQRFINERLDASRRQLFVRIIEADLRRVLKIYMMKCSIIKKIHMWEKF